MQVGAGESKLLLFETFSLFYFYLFFSLERFLEELALLKIQDIQQEHEGAMLFIYYLSSNSKQVWIQIILI